MKFPSLTVVTTAIVLGATSGANAQSFSLGLEGLSLTPSRSDGLSTSEPDASVGRETSARVQAGYTFANGLGIRAEVWDMDVAYDEGQNGGPSEIDFTQVDLVGFRAFEVAPGLSMELSAGLRQLEYADRNFADSGSAQTLEYDAFGAVFGVKATQAVFGDGGVYGSFETAALVGDAIDEGDPDPQTNMSQLSIGLGYEHRFDFGATTTTLRAGYEMTEFNGLQDSSDGGFAFDGLVLGASFAF